MTHATKTATLTLLPDATISALSSDGRTTYVVKLSPPSCTCPGYVHYGHCYHMTQALARFGAQCSDCGSETAYRVNHQDADGSIYQTALCAPGTGCASDYQAWLKATGKIPVTRTLAEELAMFEARRGALC